MQKKSQYFLLEVAYNLEKASAIQIRSLGQWPSGSPVSTHAILAWDTKHIRK